MGGKGDLLKVQVCKPFPRPTESDLWGSGAQEMIALTSHPGDFKTDAVLPNL